MKNILKLLRVLPLEIKDCYDKLMLFLDFLFPKRCLDCGRIGKYICLTCQKKLVGVQEVVCPECERLAVGGQVHPHCQRRFTLDGLVSLWAYQGLIKEAVKTVKYRFVADLIKEISDLIKQRVQDQAKNYLEFWQFMAKSPIVIPVPLHMARLRWRGFNQAEVLGRKFASYWRLPFSGRILERIKATQPQVELTGEKRQQNVQGAFALTRRLQGLKKPLRNKRFLLIDDVWTTGATMRECGRKLKRGGAKEVWGLTLAR